MLYGNYYPLAEHRQNAQGALVLVNEKMKSGEYQMLILDEINNALEVKLVELEKVLALR